MIPKLDLYQKKHELMSADEIRPGLEAMERALARLGNPEKGQHFIHLAGTNGKGSTVAFMESIARAHGLRTGSFTSPAMTDLHDQIRLDGRPVTGNEADSAFAEMKKAGLSGMLTDFELLTAAAFLVFKNHQPYLIFLEAGMGGRFDSTNVVMPEASAITSIGLDHTGFLGGTLKEIAWHKAGILKRGVPGIIGPLQTEAFEEVKRVANETGVPISVYGQDFTAIPGIRPGLSGPHQHVNLAIAAEALKAAGIDLDPSKLKRGAETAFLPGRFEEISPGVFLDGAHNPAAADALVQSVKDRFGEEAKVRFMVGMLARKDYRSVIRILEPVARSFIFIDFAHSDAAPAHLLAACTKLPSVQINAEQIQQERWSPAEIPLIVTGSLYLLSELRHRFL
ncbi:bifunctional folylpolyglutamate synthase/dihydrofolate synthase [Bhargavaea massiliensis]|uniref:bifunctional folylpolyglutamate synthase/dihydrofolate synthase n=1 Tax=Bhargavaea massiliensis TaxID=2697500 RepID=UPI001BCAF989|nr:Mur ligase family protein [Bhargavaea massiliensis]